MSRTVVVTGAGSGIGAAIARAFVVAGDHVFGCDISSERLDEVGRQLGDGMTPVVLDVVDEEAVAHAIRAADERTGRLDVVISNAGVGDGQPPFVDTTTELWWRVLSINLGGAFFVGREAARIMVGRGRGRIINVASVSAFSGRANGVPYTVSKAGIFGMTQRMAYELGSHGITVNAILPGSVTTGIAENTRDVLGATFPGAEQPVSSPEALRTLVPAGRRGRPEEVAAAASFLASDEASYVNGVMLPVDGGWLAC